MNILRIPIEYLLSKSDDSQRKIVLRDVAKELGLSHKIALRPKKAAQYSSGFSKGIQKLAKRKGLTIQGYLSKMMKFNSII